MRGVIAPTSVSRAHAIAARFAADPPLTSTPADDGGYPIHERNHSRTVSSSWLAPDASRHDPLSMFIADAMRSPSAPGHVPAPGM
jgi:hypothetical protein